MKTVHYNPKYLLKRIQKLEQAIVDMSVLGSIEDIVEQEIANEEAKEECSALHKSTLVINEVLSRYGVVK